MERLKERITVANRALETLKELALIAKPTKTERDAAIQRFEYTFEACWKAAQRYLQEVEGLTTGSPKGCIRASRETELLSTKEAILGLKMTDDRNLTVHTYDESIANSIFKNLPAYVNLMGHWLNTMEKHLKSKQKR